MEGIVLKRPAVDERAAVWKNNHPVAEHVPAHGLRGDRACLRIEHGRLQIGITGQVTRAGDNQHLAIVQ